MIVGIELIHLMSYMYFISDLCINKPSCDDWSVCLVWWYVIGLALMAYLICLPSYNCELFDLIFWICFHRFARIFGLSPCFLFCLRWIKTSTVELSNWHFGLGAGRNQRLSGFLMSWSHVQRLGVRFQLFSCLVSIARLGCLWKLRVRHCWLIHNLVYCKIR